MHKLNLIMRKQQTKPNCRIVFQIPGLQSPKMSVPRKRLVTYHRLKRTKWAWHVLTSTSVGWPTKQMVTGLIPCAGSQVPVGGVTEATYRCFSHKSMFLSLSFSFPFPSLFIYFSLEINKLNLKRGMTIKCHVWSWIGLGLRKYIYKR